MSDVGEESIPRQLAIVRAWCRDGTARTIRETACGASLDGRRARARFCGPTCRSRQSRGARAPVPGVCVTCGESREATCATCGCGVAA